MENLSINEIQRALVDASYNVFDLKTMQKVSKCSLEDVYESIERMILEDIFSSSDSDTLYFEPNILMHASFVMRN